MKVAAVIVGINQWKDYTFPLIKSLHEHEPKCDIIVVDNGSDPPYPEANYFTTVHIQRTCYAAAINDGMLVAGEASWYLVMNNDVLCTGPFFDKLRHLSPNAIYGSHLNGNQDFPRYVEGWIFYIPSKVVSAVGLFDEKFKVAGYDDVDYCYRANRKGYPSEKAKMPFKHLKAGTRNAIPGYKEIRKENREYFREKHGLR